MNNWIYEIILIAEKKLRRKCWRQESNAADDLDFSDLKKRKSNKKKATFDLEAFERELGDSAEGGAGKEDGDFDGDDLDDGELGDDVFARDESEGHRTVDPGSEAWVGTDRDYLYPEASFYLEKTCQLED